MLGAHAFDAVTTEMEFLRVCVPACLIVPAEAAELGGGVLGQRSRQAAYIPLHCGAAGGDTANAARPHPHLHQGQGLLLPVIARAA